MTNNIQESTKKERDDKVFNFFGYFTITLFVLFIIIGFDYLYGNYSINNTGLSIGERIVSVIESTTPTKRIGLGTIIAVLMSWDKNKSVLWALVHGTLGWLYIVYSLIVIRE